MVQLATDLVKSLLVPGSMAFLVVGMIVGVVLLYSRLHRWGRRWLTALALLYVALAMPVTSDVLEGRPGAQTVTPLRIEDARAASAVVVLGNGALTYTDGTSQLPALTRRTAFNVMEGARVYHALGHPRVILSGGIPNPEIQKQPESVLMAAAIVGLGVPRSDLVLESGSWNTYEQSVRVRGLLPPDSTIVLVTTPIHMARAVRLFEAQRLKVLPSASRIDYQPATLSWPARLVPNAGSLRASELAMYEYLALVNGWARGWLTRSDTLQ